MTAIANPAARRTAPRVTVQQITANDLVIRTPPCKGFPHPNPRPGVHTLQFRGRTTSQESHHMSTHADKVREFLDAFEEVFDRDWAYTKEMPGIYDMTEEQKRARAEAGLGSIPIVADDITFVHPKVEDEVEDWGNRGWLLLAYRALRKELP